MAKTEVRLERRARTVLYGVWGTTSDRTISKDIPSLSSKYYDTTQTREGTVLPFFVLSRNYDAGTGASELFIAGLRDNGGLRELVLPDGTYAVITIKPRFGMLWGFAVGEAKRFFYTKWLPQSGYCAQNLEYEYHSEKTVGKKPTVDLIFAIQKRT